MLFLPHLFQINSQLLALFIKMAALQSQRFGSVGDVVILALDLVKNYLSFKLVNALGQSA